MTDTAVVVDDSSFQRSVIKEILQEEFEVVGEAADGSEAVDVFEETGPDLITMDIAMPNVDGVEATAEIKDRSSDATVVMCTSMEQEEQMKRAIRNGADGYVTKPVSEENLLDAVTAAL